MVLNSLMRFNSNLGHTEAELMRKELSDAHYKSNLQADDCNMATSNIDLNLAPTYEFSEKDTPENRNSYNNLAG